MKRKVILPLDTRCTIEELRGQYEASYRVAIPDFVFFEMIVNLGIDYMSEMLDAKTDFKKSEVN